MYRTRRQLLLGAALLLFILPSTLKAQHAPEDADDTTLRISYETGYMNWGEIAPEKENFIRLGQSGGFDLYHTLGLHRDGIYVRMTLAPTSLYRWSISDTITGPHFGGGTRSSDPRESRFRYRPQGSARDNIMWSSISGGYEHAWRATDGRVGFGLASISQCDHSFWGACPLTAPMFEIGGSAHWRFIGAACSAQAVMLGRIEGGWSVLLSGAGWRGEEREELRKRTIKPLSCGVSVRF